jgi:hypothetical protein
MQAADAGEAGKPWAMYPALEFNTIFEVGITLILESQFVDRTPLKSSDSKQNIQESHTHTHSAGWSSAAATDFHSVGIQGLSRRGYGLSYYKISVPFLSHSSNPPG